MAIVLNGVFKDNMILQRDKEIRIFGETEPGNASGVSAVIRDSNGDPLREGRTTEVYDDGFFIVSLESLPAGGPYTLEVSAGDPDTVRLSGIYMGDIWLASGQGNIEYCLGRSEGAAAEIPRCPADSIHFYRVPVASDFDARQRDDERTSGWKVLSPENCADVSGIGYFFAKELSSYIRKNAGKDDPEVRIGVIGCYLGGTSISCWQSIEALDSTREGRSYIESYSEAIRGKTKESYAAELDEYENECAEYNKYLSRYLHDNPNATYYEVEHKLGFLPWPPPAGPTSVRRPGALFNTMVQRLVPLSMTGVIFYQGEDDCEDHYADYAVVFRSMIEEWREAFWDPELPFIFCQLPMYISKDRRYMGYDDMHWPTLRKCQAVISKTVPKTYMAVLADCGEFDNVHPSDKRTPGERLAKLALRFVYRYSKVPAVAPYVLDVRRGEGVEITFGGDFDQLKLLTGFGGSESGFEVAGEDNRFYRAEASIDFDGRTVILYCRQVEFPVKVRYAYFSYGPATLTGDSGLAAAPFEVEIDKGISSYY